MGEVRSRIGSRGRGEWTRKKDIEDEAMGHGRIWMRSNSDGRSRGVERKGQRGSTQERETTTMAQKRALHTSDSDDDNNNGGRVKIMIQCELSVQIVVGEIQMT